MIRRCLSGDQVVAVTYTVSMLRASSSTRLDEITNMQCISSITIRYKGEGSIGELGRVGKLVCLMSW